MLVLITLEDKKELQRNQLVLQDLVLIGYHQISDITNLLNQLNLKKSEYKVHLLGRKNKADPEVAWDKKE